MKKERILLLGGNFYPEPTGIGKYNGEMIEWLSKQGYQCGVVTTYPYYPYWNVQAPYVNKSSWYKKEEGKVFGRVPLKVYRCPHYVPATPCGKTRVLSDLSFFLSAFFQVVALLFRRPYDYVIAVGPPFQLGLLGLLYKWVKGAKLIYHIQDLQIDAAYELGMIKSKTLVNVMLGLERFILRKADYVSSISEGMIEKIKAKFYRPVILFPNWADTQTFYPVLQKQEIRREFNFSTDDKIVLYSGAIGEKQGLQTMLYAAGQLRDRSDIKFVICGSGPYRQHLVNKAEEMNLTNVIFMPLQNREKFNRFLNTADVHLVLQKANANDLMMPSKLTTILSIGGLALVTAERQSSLYTLLERNKMGLLTEPENEAALTEAILYALEHSHADTKQKARRFAEEQLTIDKVVARFFSHVTGEAEPVTTFLSKTVEIDTAL